MKGDVCTFEQSYHWIENPSIIKIRLAQHCYSSQNASRYFRYRLNMTSTNVECAAASVRAYELHECASGKSAH